MNKICIIALLISMLGSATGVFIKQHPVGHKAAPVCEIYNRCAAQPGVEATFVEAMRFNDSVILDLTTIAATSDEGWEWMCDSLQLVPHFLRSTVQNFEITHLAPACNPETTTPLVEGEPCDLVVVSNARRKIFIFHDYRPSYRRALADY